VAAVAEADGMLTQALRGLLAVAEAYPDLKASANFLSLQEELSGTENKVGFARQYYNDSVRALNETIVAIPGKFFAGFANVVAREFYVVDDPSKRVTPNVSFN
jgi:LemA protein